MGAQAIKATPASSSARARDVSMDGYRQHLTALSALVDTCATNRNTISCDPALIGPDDRVPIANGSGAQQRLIRYGWLRVLFSKAEDPDQPVPKTAASKAGHAGPKATIQDQPPTSQLLQEAKLRLEGDLAQSQAAASPVASHAGERAVLQQVLSQREFRGLKQTSVRDSVLEKFGNWLNRLFESAANLKARSAWVGRVLVWGFILGVCVALVYSLLRLERRWRVRLTEEGARPAPGAASARHWQLWLEDARNAAAAGRWREAIHFVYWAAISRLESRRLWPADRARTPREYLALVAPEDPRKPGLSQLTGAFERFWYGGREAGESDYKNAENLASSLIAGGAPAAHEFTTAPEGGAR
ncbi:MAG TPA: DUF4129 domain-containing protein [Candidatus Sulfopaludibacter sp.]|nr:DUF4129 domain-containing protein [Candidatus Sulfopaludibacter sp.]